MAKSQSTLGKQRPVWRDDIGRAQALAQLGLGAEPPALPKLPKRGSAAKSRRKTWQAAAVAETKRKGRHVKENK